MSNHICTYLKEQYVASSKKYPYTAVVAVALITFYRANSNGNCGGGEKVITIQKPDAIESLCIAEYSNNMSSNKDYELVESVESDGSKYERTNNNGTSIVDVSIITVEQGTNNDYVTDNYNNDNDNNSFDNDDASTNNSKDSSGDVLGFDDVSTSLASCQPIPTSMKRLLLRKEYLPCHM